MKRLCFILLAASLSSGCSEETPDPVDPTDPPAAQHSIDIASFNMGLAHSYVPHAAERLEPVVAAVSAGDADVICLQEIWLEDDLNYLIETASDNYPHAYSHHEAVEASEEPACNDVESATALSDCATVADCDNDPDFSQCVLSNCFAEYNGLEPACQECLAASIGEGNVAAIFEICTEGSVQWLYDGRHGLVILSKKPFERTQYVPLDSWLIVRAGLFATVDDVKMVCTHLSTDLGTQYQGEHGSFEGENLHQTQSLIAWMEQEESAHPKIILGDFNAAPALDGLIGEYTEAYGNFGPAGYSDANCESENPFCTWCAHNTLNNHPVNSAIDHILVRDGVASNPRRIHDQTVTITVEGEPVESHLSDHFGMQVTLSWDAE